MTEMYGNRVYPHSRRIYSRPYSCHHMHLLPDQSLRPVMEFLDSFLDFGEEAIGQPFQACCDIDKFPPLHVSPPHWHEERIADNKAVQHFYRQYLSQDGIAALDDVVHLIEKHRWRGQNMRILSPHDGYKQDWEELREALKTLWDNEIIIDPRVSYMEELFIYSGDDPIADWRYNGFGRKDRVIASLEWLMLPENADRVSRMFLYSRLAQHFGEVDRRSFTFAQAVHDDLDIMDPSLVAMKLKENPEAYFHSKTFTDDGVSTLLLGDGRPAEKKSFLPDIRRVFSFAGLNRPKPPKVDILNRNSLIETADRMIADHQRLNDGSWAMMQIKLLDPVYQFKSNPALPSSSLQIEGW